MGIYSRKDEEYILKRDAQDAKEMKDFIERKEKYNAEKYAFIEKHLEELTNEYNNFISFLKSLPAREITSVPNGVTSVYSLEEDPRAKRLTAIELLRSWNEEDRDIFKFLKHHLKMVYKKDDVFYIPEMSIGSFYLVPIMRVRCAVLLDTLGSKEPFLEFFKEHTGREFRAGDAIWLYKDKEETLYKNGEIIIR